MKDARCRVGFTLVELLVVITIIGILISLLLPAVQSAREAARRAQCQNNLKQLGLALQNYHTSHRAFPPSAHWQPATASNIQSTDNPNLSENWVIMVLPFLEQQPLYDRFDRTRYITDAVNQVARGTVLSLMQCPSDGYSRVPYDGTRYNQGPGWARGNYAANGALGKMTLTGHSGVEASAFPESAGWQSSLIRGVMGANCSLSIGEIRDGSSNTVLVGEIRAGVVAYDTRGVWAMSGACPSALWAHGYIGDANGPNAGAVGADDTNGCSDVHAAVGGAANLARMGMPCAAGSRANYQQASRSLHPGGVHVCLADGSVHFIGNYVQLGTSSSNLGVWDRLNLSSDGLPIDASAF